MSRAAVCPCPVIVVDRDDESGKLLVRYLQAHGWQAELVTDPRRVVRRRARSGQGDALVVLELHDDDPDAFELLSAAAVHRVAARVVVCARHDLDLRALRVDRVLPERCPFSTIAAALSELREDCVLSYAAE